MKRPNNPLVFALYAAVFVLLNLAANPSFALEDSDVVDIMQKATAIAAGRPLTDGESAGLADDTLSALATNRIEIEAKLPILAQTAMYMQMTDNAATHGILYDSLRQIYEESFVGREDPVALQVFLPEDELVDSHEPGAGLALSDIYASAWLRALYQGRFDHPDDVALTESELADHILELRTKFASEVPENQQVMSRMNAWAAGVRANWDLLSAEERRIVTGVSTEPDIPSQEIVMKVTGSSDLFKWLAGMDLTIDDNARSEFAQMVKYHEDGNTGQAMSGLFARLGAGGDAGTWSEFQSLQMLRNLNNYYSNGGLLSGNDAGGFMLGLQ